MIQPSFLRQTAAERLQQSAYNPKRFVLLHTAVAIGCFLLTTLANYLFSLQIADTGGLSGMELRSVLATAQSVLELAVTVGLPFWNIALYFAALRWAKGQSAEPADLLQGFRRFRSVLGLQLLRGILFIALGIPLSYIAAAIFMLTPFSAPLWEKFAPMMDQGITPEQLEVLVTPEFTAATMQAMVPLLIIFVIVYLAVAIPLFYRLRFSDFAVMEDLTCGKAVLKSIAVTRKNCLQIFKLDLSFWWYYLLLALSILISNGDRLLSAMGISLPLSADASYFVFYLLGFMCQGVLLWQCEARRLTTYCLAYHSLAREDTSDTDDTPANDPV